MPQALTYQSDYTGQQMDARFAAVPELQQAVATILASLGDYYTKDQVDAIAAAITSTAGVTAEELPSASADTLGKMYYVGPDGDGEYNRYITGYDGTDYSWLPLGSTAIDLTDYVTQEEFDALAEDVEPIIDAVDDLNWGEDTHSDFVFNGESSKAVLKTPIVLSQNGDSIEFWITSSITGAISGTGAYNFSQGGSATTTNWKGIAANADRFCMRTDDATWIYQQTGSRHAGHFKFEYKNGNIVLSRPGYDGDDVTYTGQKTLTIRQFGYSPLNSETDKYWAGTIQKMKVNGVDYDLAKMAVLTDVTYTTTPAAGRSFMTPEEKAGLSLPLHVVGRSDQNEVGIFAPSKNKYVEYRLRHIEDVSSNIDTWVLGNAYKAAADFTRDTQITAATGNWECAIKISGKDFIGGPAHGNEVADSVLFLVDGAVKSFAELADGFDCENFRVILTSTLYDPSDGTTEVAEHTLLYEWTRDALHISQTVKWLAAETLAESYLAMFPAAQAVTDHYCSDKNFAPVAIPSGGLSNVVITDIRHFFIWGEDSGVFAEFGIEDYPSAVTPPRFLGTNNAGTTYNKLYYYSSLPDGGTTVQVGDIWKARTVYRISVS